MNPTASFFGQTVVSFLLQLMAMSAIPFLVYLAKSRKVRGFLPWIGLKRAPLTTVLIAAAIAAVIATAMTLASRSVLAEAGTVSGNLLGQFQEHGWSGWLIATLLVTAWFKTALTEEIFFRGFVAARLIAWLGFARGNAIQAALFGGIHLLFLAALPAEQRTVAVAALMLLGPGVGGWISGYMNHRMAGGSILPGWVMHGLGNTIAYALPLILA